MSKEKEALEFLLESGQVEGAHHKAWVIDQVIRILAGNDYWSIRRECCAGEDGPDTYPWNEGIPP